MGAAMMQGERAERATVIPMKWEDSVFEGASAATGILYADRRSEDCSAVRCRERFR